MFALDAGSFVAAGLCLLNNLATALFSGLKKNISADETANNTRYPICEISPKAPGSMYPTSLPATLDQCYQHYVPTPAGPQREPWYWHPWNSLCLAQPLASKDTASVGGRRQMREGQALRCRLLRAVEYRAVQPTTPLDRHVQTRSLGLCTFSTASAIIPKYCDYCKTLCEVAKSGPAGCCGDISVV